MSTVGQESNCGGRSGQRLTTEGERLDRCDDCRKRITKGTKIASSTGKRIEYGHRKGCPERPSECDPSGPCAHDGWVE